MYPVRPKSSLLGLNHSQVLLSILLGMTVPFFFSLLFSFFFCIPNDSTVLVVVFFDSGCTEIFLIVLCCLIVLSGSYPSQFIPFSPSLPFSLSTPLHPAGNVHTPKTTTDWRRCRGVLRRALAVRQPLIAACCLSFL
ncbi:hypothetical protein T492DRAFT_57991 [Pavlovales sp. CCMP2436]|nr:hypothetical protein T492DRAFT_57991 [Pavlovales sp. CCMP2436]